MRSTLQEEIQTLKWQEDVLDKQLEVNIYKNKPYYYYFIIVIEIIKSSYCFYFTYGITMQYQNREDINYQGFRDIYFKTTSKYLLLFIKIIQLQYL